MARGHSCILLFVVTPLEQQPAAGASARVTPSDLSRPLLAQLGQSASAHCSPAPLCRLPPALGCGAVKGTQPGSGGHIPIFWAGIQMSQALLSALPHGTGPRGSPGPCLLCFDSPLSFPHCALGLAINPAWAARLQGPRCHLGGCNPVSRLCRYREQELSAEELWPCSKEHLPTGCGRAGAALGAYHRT